MKFELANLSATWRPPGALALSIETARIAVTSLRRDNGGSRLLQSLSLDRGAETLLEDPKAAGRALGTALTEAGVRERRCVVSLPPGWALVTSTELPAVTGDDLKSYFELCAERAFPIPIVDLHLAHCPYQLPNGKRAATLAAVSSKRMNAVKEMLATAGCRPVSISLGVTQCLGEDGENLPAAMHFLANGKHVDLVVTAGGGIVSLRSISLALNPAENGTSLDTESFGREVRLALGRLPGDLRDQIRTARVSGPETSAHRLLNETREPLRRLGIGTVTTDDNSSDAAVVAARRHLLGQPLPFEFVAPHPNRWQTLWKRFDTRRHRWVALLALAFVVVPILALTIRSHQERRLQTEWNRIRPAVADLEIVQADIRQFRSWYDGTPRSLAIFEALVSAFPETGEVWAKTIEWREGSRVACAGLALNQAAWMAFLDRLRARPEFREVQVQQVRGENPIQFAFTCVWVPIHDN